MKGVRDAVHQMKRARHDRQAGFSLLELVIALALLAVIAALLLAGIADARRALSAVDRRGAQAAVAPVQAVLRRLIKEARKEARPAPDGQRPPDPDRAFAGRPDRLSFVSSFVPQGQYGGLQRYRIGLDATGPGPRRLVMAQERVPPAPNPPTPRDGGGTVLLDGVKALHVRYFGPLDPDTPPAWHDTWNHPVNLPLLVSVDVTFVRGDRRQWVTLVASPALAP